MIYLYLVFSIVFTEPSEGRGQGLCLSIIFINRGQRKTIFLVIPIMWSPNFSIRYKRSDGYAHAIWTKRWIACPWDMNEAANGRTNKRFYVKNVKYFIKILRTTTNVISEISSPRVLSQSHHGPNKNASTAEHICT